MNPIDVINIPTLNHDCKDIDELIKIKNKLDSGTKFKILNFTHCNFLGPTAVAILAACIRHSTKLGFTVSIHWESISKKVLINLCQNGFAEKFGYKKSGWIGNSIPFREDNSAEDNSDEILDHLTNRWLVKDWIDFSEDLRSSIAGRVWEIFINAFEHAESKIGIFSCGQHFQTKKEIVLSVVDFGVGIPHKVRMYFSKIDTRFNQLTDESCLRWAFTSGNSTANPNIPRGLGLDLLRDFVYINNGSLEIFSGQGYAIANGSGLSFHTRTSFFPGTCVQLKMICDGRHYKFSNSA